MTDFFGSPDLMDEQMTIYFLESPDFFNVQNFIVSSKRFNYQYQQLSNSLLLILSPFFLQTMVNNTQHR